MESNMKNKKHFFGATSLNNGEEITHHYIDVYNEYFDEYLRQWYYVKRNKVLYM